MNVITLAVLSCNLTIARHVPIEDIPSPPKMITLNGENNVIEIRRHLSKLKAVLEQYAPLTPEEKANQIRLWVARVKTKHETLTEKIFKKAIKTNVVSKEMDRYDLSKVDILLFSDNLKPAFHDDNSLLKEIYRARSGPGFSLLPLAEIVAKKKNQDIPLLVTGPPSPEELFSFDQENVWATKRFLKWAAGRESLRDIPYWRPGND